MNRAAVAILCAALAAPAHAGPAETTSTKKRIIWASMLSVMGALDLAATNAAERRGAVEVSPLPVLVGKGGRLPLKAVGVLGAIAGAQALRQKGHPKWAWVLIGGIAIVWRSAAMLTHTQARPREESR